jgi:hypothetical protein
MRLISIRPVGSNKTRLKTICIIVLILFIVVASSGCDMLHGTPDKYFTMHSGDINQPVQVTLLLSQAPKLGETTDIVLTSYIHILFQIDPQSIANSRAWVEFTWANIYGSYSDAENAVSISADEVLVNGNLTWAGSIGLKDRLELRSTVKLPREGVWAITGYFTGEGWQKPLTTQMRLAVTKDAATVIGTREFYSGPLAYLGYIGYGQGGDRRLGLSEIHPEIMLLDISKSPRIGEEAILTCQIYSLYDVSDFPVQVTFEKRTGGRQTKGVSGDILLLNGLLNWTGNIKRDNPTLFSATIKFPEEGDWAIHAQSDYLINGQPGLADNLRLHISDKLSYFGWMESP